MGRAMACAGSAGTATRSMARLLACSEKNSPPGKACFVFDVLVRPGAMQFES